MVNKLRAKYQELKEKRAKDRRRFWRILINPKMQFRFSGYFLFIAISLIILVNAMAFNFLIELANIGNSSAPGTEVASIVFKTFQNQKWILLSGVGVFVLGLLLFAIRMTHEVSGPAYALTKHVDAILQGDFNHKTTLRKGDELTVLRDKLNKLSDELKRKCDKTIH